MTGVSSRNRGVDGAQTAASQLLFFDPGGALRAAKEEEVDGAVLAVPICRFDDSGEALVAPLAGLGDAVTERRVEERLGEQHCRNQPAPDAERAGIAEHERLRTGSR